MSSSSHNPFALPGMQNAFPDPNFNPLLASMDMMRQAMGGLASSTGSGSEAMSTPLTPEDLERRISELKVVENWLKLNLSMLGSTIQGLEVQLATIKTLRSFVAMGTGAASNASADASPLEVVLGLKSAKGHLPTPPAQAAEPDCGVSPASESAPPAAQAWWDLLQGQFNQLATAAASASKLAESVGDQVQSNIKKSTQSTTAVVNAMTKTKPPAKRAAKKNPRQSPVRKRATKSNA